jgi:LysM repeat protein
VTSPHAEPPASGPAQPPVRRWLRRATAGTTLGGLLLLAVPVAYVDAGAGRTARTTTIDAGPLLPVSAHPRNHPWRGHPGRIIHHYTVKPGDSVYGLAVRFHAWTDELMALNHLNGHTRLHIGEKLRIPVVVAAARNARHHKHRAGHHHKPTHDKAHHGQRHHNKHHKPSHHKPHKHKAHHHRHGWRHADASRAKVRHVVARTAARHGVHPRLALAIAWQESGWQQRRISSAGAIGAMQVMPGTGRWVSQQVNRRLNLRGLHDNVTAGVVLIKILRSQAGTRAATAGYYQGLASVRRYGLYPSTKDYLQGVMATRKRLKHGWDPA